jgi:hypothetical protein
MKVMADGKNLVSHAGTALLTELFGPVASVPTAWRAVHATTTVELREIPRAVAAAREKIWAAAPPGDSLTLDVDATLVTAHADKQDATPTYKHGYGFHPLGVRCDTTNEPLAAMLRPGNAGPNNAADHLELLDRALAALPAEYQVGHDVGDSPTWWSTRSWCGPTRPAPPTTSFVAWPTASTRSASGSTVGSERP